MNNRVNKMVKISLIISLALIVNFLESLIPLPIPLPGVKIGLANFLGLIVLCLYGSKDYVVFNVLKVLMTALLRGGFGMSFLISSSGALFAVTITLILYKWKKASIYGISVAGAVFHALGQILSVILLYSNIYLINYLAFLEIASVISGLITAYIANNVLRQLPSKIRENG